MNYETMRQALYEIVEDTAPDPLSLDWDDYDTRHLHPLAWAARDERFMREGLVYNDHEIHFCILGDWEKGIEHADEFFNCNHEKIRDLFHLVGATKEEFLALLKELR